MDGDAERQRGEGSGVRHGGSSVNAFESWDSHGRGDGISSVVFGGNVTAGGAAAARIRGGEAKREQFVSEWHSVSHQAAAACLVRGVAEKTVSSAFVPRHVTEVEVVVSVSKGGGVGRRLLLDERG